MEKKIKNNKAPYGHIHEVTLGGITLTGSHLFFEPCLSVTTRLQNLLQEKLEETNALKQMLEWRIHGSR